MKKRGMTSKMIIGLIIAAIGFIFLTVLLMRSIKIVDPEREVCALSVTHRSSFNLGPWEPGREYIPLNCKTQKLCLQGSGDNCATTGVISTPKNKVTNIKLSDKEREVQIEILDVVSDAMYRCHDMLGKGKLNFMPHSLWDTNYCVICTRIGVDDETKAKGNIPVVTQEMLNEYMQDRVVPNSEISYLEFIYGTRDADDMKLYIEEAGQKIEERGRGSIDLEKISATDIDLNKGSYAIIAQAIPDGTIGNWLGATVGGVAVAGGIIAVPLTLGSSLSVTGVGIAVLAGGGAGMTFYTASTPNKEFTYGMPMAVQYESDSLKVLNCYEFEGAP